MTEKYMLPGLAGVLVRAFDLMATDPETLLFLAGLVRAHRPKVIVEAGTYRGHGTVHLGTAAKMNDIGHVWSADPYMDDCVPDLVKENRLDHTVTLHRGDYVDMVCDLTEPIDLAFIDASAEGVGGAALRWQHFEVTRALMAPNGLIVVHDTAADDWSDGEGGRSVQRIRAACQINLIANRGLSIYAHHGS